MVVIVAIMTGAGDENDGECHIADYEDDDHDDDGGGSLHILLY